MFSAQYGEDNNLILNNLILGNYDFRKNGINF